MTRRNARSARMISARQHDYVSNGQLTDLGVVELVRLRDKIDDVLGGHSDNTHSGCRIDLDEHDCCYTCNDVEAALRAYLGGVLFDA